jgi:hypothetical protein
MVQTIYPPTLLCDFYKVSHRPQYPQGTEFVYSTWIPRGNKYFPQADKVVAWGPQAFTKKYLIDYFNVHFFSRSKEEVVAEYQRVIYFTLINPGNVQGVENTAAEIAARAFAPPKTDPRSSCLQDFDRAPICRRR